MDGFITGVRFYKGSQNTGTHVGNLWTTSGQRLATATFSDETASGWQEVTFSAPVPVTANTTYVASYHTTSGYYSADSDFFATAGVDTPPLHALATGVSGGNGVYAYSATFDLPVQHVPGHQLLGGRRVHHVHRPGHESAGSDRRPHPATDATDVPTSTQISASFNEALDPASVSGSTASLVGPGGTSVAASVTYDASSRSVVIQPQALLATLTTYTARIEGGNSGPRVTDVAGNALAQDRVWSFTTAPPSACDNAANEIVAENCLPGAPASEWDVTGAGDSSIQGYATDISVNQGEHGPVQDRHHRGRPTGSTSTGSATTAAMGARMVDSIPSTVVTATNQPDCTTTTSRISRATWSTAATGRSRRPGRSLPTPPPGIYIARPTRTDNGGASHIVFVVRDDDGRSDLLFQTSDTTWQAYNPYGGYNAYNTGSTGIVSVKLSYNRPFTTRGGEKENWLFNSEYPMLRWLERNGYDVSYSSSIDTERLASEILEHKTFLSVGHDEYWSQGRRDAVTAARNAGTHLAFFSGNEIYWKIRWENSALDPRAGNQRTMVVYKEGSAAPSRLGRAPQLLQQLRVRSQPHLDRPVARGGLRRSLSHARELVERADQLARQHRVHHGARGVRGVCGSGATPVSRASPPGEQVSLAYGTLGYEWNPEYPEYADYYPAGRIKLSTTNVTSFIGPEQHHLSMYRAPSGALVFGAGTVQWAWGLDGTHDRGTSTQDRNVQQATLNLFADMGVQPAARQGNLSAAAASTDSDGAVGHDHLTCRRGAGPRRWVDHRDRHSHRQRRGPGRRRRGLHRRRHHVASGHRPWHVAVHVHRADDHRRNSDRPSPGRRRLPQHRDGERRPSCSPRKAETAPWPPPARCSPTPTQSTVGSSNDGQPRSRSGSGSGPTSRARSLACGSSRPPPTPGPTPVGSTATPANSSAHLWRPRSLAVDGTCCHLPHPSPSAQAPPTWPATTRPAATTRSPTVDWRPPSSTHRSGPLRMGLTALRACIGTEAGSRTRPISRRTTGLTSSW